MSAQAIPLTDLYTALGQAVKYYPMPDNPGRLCDALQAFRVFGSNRLAELADDSLGVTACDGDKPYFFSRLWEEQGRNPNAKKRWNYPLLYAFDVRFIVDNRTAAFTLARHEIQIGVLDVLSEDAAKGCTGCNARTIPEVMADTKRHLLNALRYLDGMVYAKVDPTHTDARLYHTSYLEALVDAGTINSYAPTVKLLASGGVSRQDLEFSYYERETGHVYGTFTTLTFAAKSCQEPDWHFDVTNFTRVSQEAARCQTC